MRAGEPMIVLREWSTEDLRGWDALAERARAMTRAGVETPEYRRILAEVRELLRSGRLDEIDRRLEKAYVIRALLNVMHDSPNLARVGLSIDRLRRVEAARAERFTRQECIAMLGIHLHHFDRLDQWEEGLFELSAEVILRAGAGLGRKQLREGALRTVVEHPSIISSTGGPAEYAGLAVDVGSLEDHIQATGLASQMSGRFGESVRREYFLEQIRRADHRSTDLPWFAEVRREELWNAPGEGGRLFGHDLLEALADKDATPPSTAWLELVTGIPGDPRIDYSSMWRTWWGPVSGAARRRVTQWIGSSDLRLFLEAVEAYGEDNHEAGLIRMFPARKRFLEGLYDQGLVKETRLILGNQMRQWIRRNIKNRSFESAMFSRTHTAVIVIDCGDFFLVEGSHSFRLWIYMSEVDERLMDRQVGSYHVDELTVDVPRRHAENFGFGAHRDVTHQGFWQAKALEFLLVDNQMDIDPRPLLTPEDFNRLRRSGVIPSHYLNR
ncbi:hypothetical protein CZ771_11270 [Actinomycetales bacterium JB111]|nr:hypothetical protein CZ771_11270 [Actinomycetales bacterium JB111]